VSRLCGVCTGGGGVCGVCTDGGVCVALIVFTDGRYIGSVLDRNGLRPSRFYVSESNFMYMASEVGVANVAPDEVIQKGRLKPGRLLLVDTKQGVFVKDEIIKEQIATLRPVANWIDQEVLCLPAVSLGLGCRVMVAATGPTVSLGSCRQFH